MEHFNCPYCDERITAKYFIDDMDICSLELNSLNEPWYIITTPCCGKRVFSTQNWNSYKFSEREMWMAARKNYYDIFQKAEKDYKKANKDYKTICDLIWERD